MNMSVKRLRTRIKTKTCQYLRCGAKTATFLFWASLYMVVMKMTIFKGNSDPPVKDWAVVPDNYTKWLMQGPELGDDENEKESIDWLEPDNATVAELESRAARTQAVCKLRGISTQRINSKEFFVDYEHSLVWCNIFKAASSSWLYKFSILGGFHKAFLEQNEPLKLVRKKFPRPSEEELRDAVNIPGVVSLLIVREPFVRLLSAYRDKLENHAPLYYRKLARAIVAQHRKRAQKILGPIKSFGVTFYEFVAYLIQKHKSDKHYAFDEHWAPYYRFCSPCAVNFSVIAKVETLSRDSGYVIYQLGLGHVLGHVLGRRVRDRRMRKKLRRNAMNRSRDGKNTTALLKRYFSQLDERMLDDLLNIYGIDFEMFGYDPKIYRSYVRK